jgi:hypothetical protein
VSLDASTYTPDTTPIPRDDFVRAAAAAGWVLWPVRDIFEPELFQTVSGGVVTDGDYFYGWRIGDPHRGDYERALAARQVKELEEWAQEDPDRQLGAAFIYANPYQHEGSPDEGAETGQGYDGALRAAKLEYLVELHANNDDFRLDLARLICRMRGGVWIDHLGGEWGVEPA